MTRLRFHMYDSIFSGKWRRDSNNVFMCLILEGGGIAGTQTETIKIIKYYNSNIQSNCNSFRLILSYHVHWLLHYLHLYSVICDNVFFLGVLRDSMNWLIICLIFEGRGAAPITWKMFEAATTSGAIFHIYWGIVYINSVVDYTYSSNFMASDEKTALKLLFDLLNN